MTDLSQYLLAEEFDATGILWLPNDTENNLTGKLTYLPGDRITLQLYGSFIPLMNSKAHFQADVLNGITADGLRFTLVDCSQVGYRFTIPGFPVVRVSCRAIVLGHWFETSKAITFDSMSCAFENLDEWVNERVVKFKHDEDGVSYAADYSTPKPHEFQLTNVPGLLELQFTNQVTPLGSNSFSISANPGFTFHPSEPQHFEVFLDFFADLRNFLALMMGHQTSVEYYVGFNTGGTDSDDRLMANLIVPHFTPEVKQLRSYEIGLAFRDLESDFGQLVDSWLKKAIPLRETIDLFFGYLGRSDQYLHAQFLSTVQAIENFHRVIKGGQYATDQEYAPVLAELKAAIPPDFDKDWRKSLEGKLEYGNEYSLSKRLKELFRGLSSAERGLITDKYKKFVNDVVKTRNYLIHHSKKLENTALSGAEMAQALWNLKKLLAILLLKELGFTEAQVVKAMERARFH